MHTATTARHALHGVASESRSLADRRRAHLLTSVGLASYHMADYEEAERVADSALEIERAHGINGAELFRTENALGGIAGTRGPVRRRQTIQEALRTARSIYDTASIAKALGNLGLVRTDYADFQGARSYFLRKRLPMRSGTAERKATCIRIWRWSLCGQAICPAPKAGQGGAASLSRDSLRDRRTERAGAAGDGRGSEGKPARRIRRDRQCDDHRQTPRAETGGGVGSRDPRRSLREAGDMRAAAHYYDQSQRLFAASKIELEAANVLRDRAAVDAAFGDTVSARERAHRARLAHHRLGALGEELNDRFLEIELAPSDGAAERALDETDMLARSLGSAPARVRSALERATVLERRGKPQQALSRLASVRSSLGESGGRGGGRMPRSVHAHTLSWRAWILQSRPDARRSASSNTFRARTKLARFVPHTRLASGRFTPISSPCCCGKGRRQRHSRRPMVLAGAPQPSAASAHRQGARKSTAGSVLQATSLRADIDTLAAHLEAAERGDSRRGHDQPAIQRDLSDRLTRARTEYEALLARADVGDEAALVGLAPMSALRVQASLARDEALLAYFVAQDTLFTFVLRRDTILAFASGERRLDLRSQVRVLRDLFQQPSTSGNGAAAAATLYDLLIGPAVRSGVLDGVRRLLVVPDGVLTYLPFAALQDRRDGRFLIERYLLTFLPAAAALPAMRARDPSSTGATWRSASVALAPFSRDLPASATEAERFRVRLGTATTLLDGRATEHALREALAAGGVVHVATHAELNSMNPMFSEIRLAPGPPGANEEDDGRLQLFEVFGLEVRSPLVFLSGCETGVGAAGSSDFEQGEDYATLARAFLFAGARNVIATLWRIDDAGAAELADRFYAHLPTASPTEALALAQREMLRQTRYAAAYYWAGYQVSGGQ